jgi:hypothetical protein
LSPGWLKLDIFALFSWSAQSVGADVWEIAMTVSNDIEPEVPDEARRHSLSFPVPVAQASSAALTQPWRLLRT